MKKAYPFIIVSLLVSLFIYLFYRTEKTVVNEIAIRLISFKTYELWKAHVTNMLAINKLIVYSLPEGLWVFCITLTSKPYYVKLNNRRFQLVFIPLIYAIGLEVLQLFHVTNGRFDLMDIGVSALFWLVAFRYFNDISERQNILASMNLKSLACLGSYCIVYLAHVIK